MTSAEGEGRRTFWGHWELRVVFIPYSLTGVGSHLLWVLGCRGGQTSSVLQGPPAGRGRSSPYEVPQAARVAAPASA